MQALHIALLGTLQKPMFVHLISISCLPPSSWKVPKLSPLTFPPYETHRKCVYLLRKPVSDTNEI